MLERGREFLPGEFPTNLLAAQREMQIPARGHAHWLASALFDVRLGRDVHVLRRLRSRRHVADQRQRLPATRIRWCSRTRAGRPRCAPTITSTSAFTAPAPCWRRSRCRRRSKPLKLTGAGESCRGASAATAERVPLHIAFDRAGQPGRRPAGRLHRVRRLHGRVQCRRQDDGAFDLSRRCGQPRREHVRRAPRSATSSAPGDGRWRVLFRGRPDRAATVPHPLGHGAGIVVLAAGTLGSNEILMRSRERGLAVSDAARQAASRPTPTPSPSATTTTRRSMPSASAIRRARRCRRPVPASSASSICAAARDPAERLAIVEASRAERDGARCCR